MLRYFKRKKANIDMCLPSYNIFYPHFYKRLSWQNGRASAYHPAYPSSKPLVDRQAFNANNVRQVGKNITYTHNVLSVFHNK